MNEMDMDAAARREFQRSPVAQARFYGKLLAHLVLKWIAEKTGSLANSINVAV